MVTAAVTPSPGGTEAARLCLDGRVPATPSCETRSQRHPNSLRRQCCPRRPTALLQVHRTEARLLRPPHGSPVEARVREVGAPARGLVRAGKIQPCHAE